MSTPTRTRWVLQLEDGTYLPRSATRRAHTAPPSVIHEALGAATSRPQQGTRPCVFGYSVDRRLCLTFITDTACLAGDDLAAAQWLAGTPPARWVKVYATDARDAERQLTSGVDQ